MAFVEPSVLANAIMGKLYNVLTNGDATVPPSEDNFFSWNTPGTPIEVSDLEFLSQGLTGIVKKSAAEALAGATAAAPAPASAPPAGASAAPPPAAALTDDQLKTLMAQDTMRMYSQAESLARLLDFVPDVGKMNNDQFMRMSVKTDEGTLSDVYDFTLRMSQVMKTDLPDDVKANIERFRGLLQKSVTKKDIITGEEATTTEPSDLVNAYMAKMAAYDDAALQYNARRIDALTASDSRAVHDFAMNAQIYRDKVNAAMADWVSNGYKEDYEKIQAYIEQVSRRDMSLLKQEIVEDFDKARLTSPISGSDFFYTSLVPGSFPTSSGWTRFGFSGGDYEVHQNSSTNSSSWNATAGGGFLGIFGGSGDASSSQSLYESHSQVDTSQTSLSFEIAQIPIVRAWFRPAFLTSTAWRFDQNNVNVKNDRLSDGGAPPQGMMPAYPVTAIFVRKLALSLGQSTALQDAMNSQQASAQSGRGYASFGPFFLGGNASHKTASGVTSSSYGYKYENNTMYVDGMQLIGFKCHIMPKSPDPDPAIPAAAWI
ncbi:hypothetical protein Mycch_0195 [Mycolicibacterium chubuense NBB4]|uniref:Uncharacterized protein n=1 Tax=Mycolicibacterium chubuense (strain NBB4) TaxID=710421 RepID=I4BCL4_MYCCN|nr:hypothetical protein [Mycolicibacterium chubuense]AFM15021.1 hypothetical protein Mycch_0195 [Mycolicibacterium chubuense NBB4]